MNFLHPLQTHQRLQFFSGKPGPHLLVLGAIHGNETCGPQAIQKLATELQKSEITLNKGRLSLVPVCNLEAFRLGQRYVEKNLNRVIRPQAKPQAYEEKLAQNICEWIEEADVLLDLHSFHSDGEPFMVWEKSDPQSLEFSLCLGDFDILTGFSEVYQDIAPIQAHTTLGFAQSLGKMNALIECGQHKDPQAPRVAYEALRRALNFLSLLPFDHEVASTDRAFWELFKLHIKEKEGHLTQDFKEFDPVKKSQVIAKYDDGDEIKALKDSFAIFPGKEASLQSEWIFLAEKKTRKDFDATTKNS